jgi:acyl-CoA synthetase
MQREDAAVPNLATTFPDPVVQQFTEAEFWGADSTSDLVRRHAASAKADDPAYIDAEGSLTWRDYNDAADQVAGALGALDLPRGALVGVFMPDTPATHVVYLGLERAGLVVVGIGPRSGRHEIVHLLQKSQASALLTVPVFRGEDQADLFAALVEELPHLHHHVVVDAIAPVQLRINGREVAASNPSVGPTPHQLGPNDVFLVNATSGTTGLPKCVQHTVNRWLRFARHAVDAAELTERDVMMSVLPSPYGFGLWSAHFLPPLIGAPVVLMPRWDAREALELMRRHRVTVFVGVTTQVVMLLDLLESREHPPSDLRVVFTGGEAVPYERALRFETATGAPVLQFYGSNESGALSGTTIRDDQEHRLRTAGRILDEMNVELVDPATGRVINTPGAVGQPTCFGPLMSPGYFDDVEANAALFDQRGRVRMADLAVISPEGYLTVVGRVADIIIRGGMNVSATEVEAGVLTHPLVELAAVVGVPDATFGEHICAFVQVRGGVSLDLGDVQRHLQTLGMAKYTWPTELRVVDTMPRNAGEKIAKDVLRRLASTS